MYNFLPDILIALPVLHSHERYTHLHLTRLQQTIKSTCKCFFIPCELPAELSLASGVEESDGIYWTLAYTVSASAAEKIMFRFIYVALGPVRSKLITVTKCELYHANKKGQGILQAADKMNEYL